MENFNNSFSRGQDKRYVIVRKASLSHIDNTGFFFIYFVLKLWRVIMYIKESKFSIEARAFD